MAPGLSPRRRAVHLNNWFEMQGVKKCLRLLGQRTFVGSPRVDFLIEKGLEESCKNRKCQQKAYFSLKAV